MVVTSKDKQVETEIVEYQHVTITGKGNHLIWLTEDEKTVYLFAFAVEDRDRLVRVLSTCKYQNATKATVQATVEDPVDKSWVENYYNPTPGKIEEESKVGERFEEVKSVIVKDKEFEKKLPFTDCVQGMSNGRTFVIMGNNVIVYKTPCEETMSLEYLASLPVVSSYTGDEYVPKHTILYGSENSMLMVDADKGASKTSIYRMDLEKGKVVEEYKVDETIQSITQVNKNAQLKDEHEFLGITDKGIFKFDPRISKPNKCVSKYFLCLVIGRSTSPILASPVSRRTSRGVSQSPV